MVEYTEKTGETEITCPYCEHEFGDSWECGSDGEYIEESEECPECDKKFIWTRNISVDYSSQADCVLNDEEHKFSDWKNFDHESFDGESRIKGKSKMCSVCGETKYEFDK